MQIPNARFKKIPNLPEHLPDNVFPFLPVKNYAFLQLDDKRKFTVQMTQFPLVSVSALTVHKAQGQTLPGVVIGPLRGLDPSTKKPTKSARQALYVAQSRARTGATVFSI